MPTVSMRQTIARRPGGGVDSGLVRWSDVGAYLGHFYIASEAEKTRKAKAAQKQRLYQCHGDLDMLDMLDKAFTSAEIVEIRRHWIPFSKYNNVIRRVVNEAATCYSGQAIRKVAGEVDNVRYQEVLRMCRMDEVMQRVNSLAFLHRAVAIGPRMRETPASEWEPTIDTVTPACFSAVRDPLDPTQLVGLLFENDYALAPGAASGPKWRFEGWHVSFLISSHGEVLENTVEEHGLGRMRWILLTIEPPSGELLDCHTGDDLVAAQLAVWFLNLLHLKELKSSTKQIWVQGDTSQAIRNQVNDTDRTGQLPEGVSMQALDRGMDVSIFPAGANHIGETTASNYGLAPGVLKGDSVASADARELQRVPLRELRLRQQIPFRAFERDMASLLATIVAQRRPDLQFSTDGWSIDFADPQTPLGTKEANEVFEQERRLTLTSTKREVQKRNPDLDDDAADSFILENIEDELERNLAMKQLQQVSGSPGADMVDAGSGGATVPPVFKAIDALDMADAMTEAVS